MKTIIVLLVLFYFISARSREEYNYQEPDPCSGAEHISWDVNQINPYENTVIIIDPYGERGE